MKNPRFEDDAIGELRMPDIQKIKCKDCMLREKDREMGKTTIEGATLIMCEAFGIKPNEILWKNEDCPYYIDEKEED